MIVLSPMEKGKDMSIEEYWKWIKENT